MNEPSSRGWEEIRVSISLVILATVAVILRFVSKFRRGIRLELEDWFALTGLVLVFVLFIDGILWATIGGNGKHTDNLTPYQIDMFFKTFLSNRILFAITSPCVKISILLFYRRIFITRPFRIVSGTLIGACVVWSTISIFVASFNCNKDCIHGWQVGSAVPPYLWCTQIINVALDLITLCLPVWMVWNLRLPVLEKLALSGVFLLGSFVVIASIIRLVSFMAVTGNDTTYSIYTTTIWTSIEPCLGLVCACLPAIRSLFPSVRRVNSSPPALKDDPSPMQRSKSKPGMFTQELRSLSRDEVENREGITSTGSTSSISGDDIHGVKSAAEIV